MAYEGLSNTELLTVLGLPESMVDDIRTAEGDEYVAKSNEFLTALFNKIVYQTVGTMDFSNPFKKYDSFPVNYGDTIENVFIELPKGYTYDKDATDPFVRKVTDTKVLYSTINSAIQYETTIYKDLLKRATLNANGFQNIVDGIIKQLAQAMTLDEYYTTLAMLNNANIYADGIEEVELPAGNTAEENAKLVTAKIVDVTSAFTMPRSDQNKLGVKQVTPKENVLLVIKRTMYNSINLDYLTGVFNLSKVDLVKNIIVVDDFRGSDVDTETSQAEIYGDNIDMVILDTRGFDNHVALQDGGMIYNPKGRYTNHFMDLWKVNAFKYFYNARAFKFVDADSE